MSLAETQRTLWGLITGSGSVPAAEAEKVVASSPELPAARRLRIYRDMFYWRQMDVLAESFMNTTKLMGREDFLDMAREYVRKHPSEHYSLSYLGRRLPEFIREWRPRKNRSDISALAALEWERGCIFIEKDGVPAPPERFAAIPPELFGQVRLRFVPAIRLVHLDHHLTALWAALEAGKRPPRPNRSPAWYLVWRKGWLVFHATISAAEARAFRLAQEGHPLEVVCAEFGGADDPAKEAFNSIGSWFVEGLISEVELPAPAGGGGR